MGAASVLVIYESINRIANNAQYLPETNTKKTLTDIDMSAMTIAVMAITIVSKAILFALCCRIKLPAMTASATDHRNDVASNIAALFCGLIGIWLAYHHSPAILKIDTVRAFYSRTLYLVEVHIVLPKDMILAESHDIGESLQKKIEGLPEVERVY
ncbi:unnamed protein product [Rotaria magnacalcarata]|uniref:Cation efflux protein cytoplasmic domain-containing protein n=1 Tax=Rotaria magnacalcarata TaxID=392030 RepID=A0A816ZQN9_9BILA|nr:unnamed protein product [Rotaria magnacalcarata]